MTPMEIAAAERRAILDICDLARRIRLPLGLRVARALERAGREDESERGALLERRAQDCRKQLEGPEGD